jgi:type I restriction enzyme R subunit
MPHQSELQLENELLTQLQRLGFNLVVIENDNDLVSNLRIQLGRFNKTTFSDNEFAQIFNYLNKGDRFQKAKTLRDRFFLTRDDQSDLYIRFFNMDR